MPENYAVIVENDISAWADETGVLYHVPKRYFELLKPNTRVIYYKGKIKDKSFSQSRLTDEPHYFGEALLGERYQDRNSGKGDWFITIKEFYPFSAPVLARQSDGYLEIIPKAREKNYWRDGVRSISEAEYNAILNLATKPDLPQEPKQLGLLDDEEVTFVSGLEGKQTKKYVTVYERNPTLRRAALAIHGYDCTVCGFNFEKVYGEYAAGYIHVHHVVPVSERDEEIQVNPETDLVPVCANCHAVIHRKRSETVSIEEMQNMIGAQK
jgi:predicted HNH restriction endonuclease